MTFVTLPNVYTLIYEFSNTTDPLNKWRNTIDFFSPTVPIAADLIIDAWGTVLLNMTHVNDQIDKVTCYNWAKGRQPYPNGLPLFEKTYGFNGTAGTDFTPPLVSPYVRAGQEVVARIDHTPLTAGKPGRNFVRNFFGKDDIIGDAAGQWTLTGSLSAFQSQLGTRMAAANIGDHLASGSSSQKFAVVRFTAKPTPVVHGYSLIDSINFIGVTTNRQTRKNKK